MYCCFIILSPISNCPCIRRCYRVTSGSPQAAILCWFAQPKINKAEEKVSAHQGLLAQQSASGGRTALKAQCNIRMKNINR